MSTIGNQLAQDILDVFPDAPTRTLASILYKNNTSVYPNMEAARSAIRYLRGSMGGAHRHRVEGGRHFGTGPGDLAPFPKIPEGLKHFDQWEPIRFEEKKTLVLADLHMPYHDRESIETAIMYGVKMGVDGVLLLGDVHDFFSMSFWEKDPRKRDFQQELEFGRSVYFTMREAFPKAKIRTKHGNHEERYFRYMSVKAPELLGVAEFEFENIMHLNKYDIECIKDKQIVKIGKLNLIHGHEFGRSIFSPVNPARGLYLRGKANCLGAHHHTTSDHAEKDMNEKVVRCWSIGCLCDLHPDYRPINKWNHGFAIVENLGGGDFMVSNKTIINGKIY